MAVVVCGPSLQSNHCEQPASITYCQVTCLQESQMVSNRNGKKMWRIEPSSSSAFIVVPPERICQKFMPWKCREILGTRLEYEWAGNVKINRKLIQNMSYIFWVTTSEGGLPDHPGGFSLCLAPCYYRAG